jgi:hypothetical protein
MNPIMFLETLQLETVGDSPCRDRVGDCATLELADSNIRQCDGLAGSPGKSQ